MGLLAAIPVVRATWARLRDAAATPEHLYQRRGASLPIQCTTETRASLRNVFLSRDLDTTDLRHRTSLRTCVLGATEQAGIDCLVPLVPHALAA